ncbi:ABC transporter permease [Rhizobium leguminosarum]|uniref:ABC transporter permease n=1 Tax=Rhizobium leguminosarum TaxID=384 RepID=UPI003F95D19C
MSFFGLVWCSILHKPIRVAMTVISMSLAFFVFGLVQGVDSSIKEAISHQNIDRLIVCSRISCMSTLPISQRSAISSIAGIGNVSYETSFFGYYQQRNNPVAAKVVDPALFFQSYRELEIPPQQLNQMKQEPNAIIIGSDLAEKYGWKIGDNVPLYSAVWKNKDGTPEWVFHVVGIFQKIGADGPTSLTRSLIINYQYFDQVRPAADQGIVGNFVVNIEDPSQAAFISKVIDDRFANSGSETRTQSEREFAQAQIRKIGDLGSATRSVVGAVIFTMLFVIGNTVMQSTNDRTVDFAIMKALGFRSHTLTILVIGESFFICLLGAMFGLAGAILLFPSIGFVGNRQLPLEVGGLAILASSTIALIASLPPIIRISRLSVVDTIFRG